MITTIQHWEEWRACCALLRCGDATQAALQGFAGSRFALYARHVMREDEVRQRIPQAPECWHLFESGLTVARPRSGRRYKEWLFARLEGSDDHPIDVVQGGASLLMRSVVREWARHETAPRQVLSLDAPLGHGDECPALTELIPAPSEATPELNELQHLAADLAPRFFRTLDTRARLVLLARHLEIPAVHPRLTALLGVGGSRVHAMWRQIYERLARSVLSDYVGESRDWQLRLTLDASRLMAVEVAAWGKQAEEAQPLLFMVKRPSRAPRAWRVGCVDAGGARAGVGGAGA